MTANPGGGDYVPPGRKFLDWAWEREPGPREHQPRSEGGSPVWQYSSQIFDHPVPTDDFDAFTRRAMDWLRRQRYVQWHTLRFEWRRQATEPFRWIATWGAWSDPS